jgi:two-component system invasion response regulator UvrY
MDNITIMIVDDHTLIRETWQSFLATETNIKIVASCGDGQQAVDFAQKLRPDIVLLDVNMAPMNGMEVLKRIRKTAPLCRVIGLSMHSQPAYAKKLLRLGAKGYLTKNSPRQEMLNAINEVSKGNTYLCAEISKILSGQAEGDTAKIDNINSLTGRQLQVLGLLSGGSSSKEIAEELGISLKTVEAHRYEILKKMNLKNTSALVRHINSQGLEF